jgi:hypothetical protein
MVNVLASVGPSDIRSCGLSGSGSNYRKETAAVVHLKKGEKQKIFHLG